MGEGKHKIGRNEKTIVYFNYFVSQLYFLNIKFPLQSTRARERNICHLLFVDKINPNFTQNC